MREKVIDFMYFLILMVFITYSVVITVLYQEVKKESNIIQIRITEMEKRIKENAPKDTTKLLQQLKKDTTKTLEGVKPKLKKFIHDTAKKISEKTE